MASSWLLEIISNIFLGELFSRVNCGNNFLGEAWAGDYWIYKYQPYDQEDELGQDRIFENESRPYSLASFNSYIFTMCTLMIYISCFLSV